MKPHFGVYIYPTTRAFVITTMESPASQITDTMSYSKRGEMLVNGVKLHYTISGSGPHPLLCVPGAVAPSHWAFDTQLQYFGRKGSDYTVVAYDPRGYGYSQAVPRSFQVTPEHHLKIDARDAYELMQLLGYPNFSVLGWCDGGITAIHLASLFPEAVTKIAIWGSRTRLTKHDLKIINDLNSPQAWNPKFRKAFEVVYGTSEVLQTLWVKYSNSVTTTYAQSNNGETCHKEMSQVACPTLILHSAKDRVCTCDQAEYTNRCIPNSKLVILPESKHNLQVCANFNMLIENFLKD